jgi:hypothetical protein
MVELLICNQRVGGSNPSVGSKYFQALAKSTDYQDSLFPHYFPTIGSKKPKLPLVFSRTSLFSFKKVGMRTRPLEYDLILPQLIDKQPICFNVTFSATCIISDKLMVAMERIKLNVSPEVPGIDRGSQLDSQLPEHIISIFANHEALAGICTFKCLSCGRIRNNHIERKPLAQRDLPVEESDGLCGREP